MMMWTAFGFGLLFGSFIMDMLWRLLRRTERKLIALQRSLLDQQGAILDCHDAIFRKALGSLTQSDPLKGLGE